MSLLDKIKSIFSGGSTADSHDHAGDDHSGHDHAGHDHDHDHADHDHSHETASTDAEGNPPA